MDVTRKGEGSSSVPARNLTTQELEAVIRRAVELQAGSAALEDGIAQAEVLRIGQELGLEPGAMRRAIAEVRSRSPDERSVLGRSMGPGTVRCARTLRRPAAATGLLLERYLLEREYMVVQRRFPERTRYIKDSSMAAAFGRLARGFVRRERPMDLKQVDVAVAALDDTTCLVELSVDMSGDRTTAVGVALGLGSTGAAGLATAIWATPVADPYMLIGLPVIGTAWLASRAIYRNVQRTTQEKLESFLDRLEHGELSSR
jgi:hypothetical protein